MPSRTTSGPSCFASRGSCARRRSSSGSPRARRRCSTLVEQSPGLTLRALAESEGISAPALSGHIDRLESAGLIVRLRSDVDRRRVGLELTPEGERLLRSIRERRTAWLAERLEALSPADLRAVEEAIGPLRRLAGVDGRNRLSSLSVALGSRTFRSLRPHRNYRLFFAGQIVSLAGSWMQNVALAWLVLSISRSPLAVALLLFCRFAPYTLFGLFAGSVVDRFDTRRLVMWTQVASMLVSAALAVVTLTGMATLPVVYLLAALGGVTVVLDAPGRQSLTFEMVGPSELPNAVALNSGLLNASRIVGPALAGRDHRGRRRRRLLRRQHAQLRGRARRAAPDPRRRALRRPRRARPDRARRDTRGDGLRLARPAGPRRAARRHVPSAWSASTSTRSSRCSPPTPSTSTRSLSGSSRPPSAPARSPARS